MEDKIAVVLKTQIHVTFFGGFGLDVNGNLLTDEANRSLKLWNVLAYLIVHQDRDVPQSELIELFWPDDGSINPLNALKTLLYRIRTMLAPLFSPDLSPILSRRGSYAWNRDIPCILDIDRFETLCRQAEAERHSHQARVAFYREAIALYRGGFLPKLSGQLWVMPLSAHYHTLYLNAVKSLAHLLELSHEYEEMGHLCISASQIDPLDEQLHADIVRSLLRQGKKAEALAYYKKATDLLYRNLGVLPSLELRTLYTQIMRVKKGLHNDLWLIQRSLAEGNARAGAFVCEYSFFKEAYRLSAHQSIRGDTCVHVALLTLSLPNGDVPPLEVLNTATDQLLDILVHNLRRGDTISKYNGDQFVVMLPGASFKNSQMIAQRIIALFRQHYRGTLLTLTYEIQNPEVSQR